MSNFAREIKPPPPESESLSLDPGRAVQTLAKATIPGLGVNVAAALDHKGIVQGFDTEGFAGKAILTLPEAAGGALARIMAAVGKMRWEEVSRAELGGLTPPAFGEEERGIGLGI